MTPDEAVEAITGIPDLEFCEPAAEAQLRAILEQVIESAERRAFEAGYGEGRMDGSTSRKGIYARIDEMFMAYRQQQTRRQG